MPQATWAHEVCCLADLQDSWEFQSLVALNVEGSRTVLIALFLDAGYAGQRSFFLSDRFSNGRFPEDPSMVSLLSTHRTSSTGSMATGLVQKLD